MADQRILDALERLGESLSLVAVPRPAEIRLRLVPDPSEINLADFSLGGLSEPVPVPIDLTAVLKDVGFVTSTVDGDDDADPLDPAPGLGPGETPTNPLAAIDGILVRLTGQIGLPVDPGHVSVSSEICWQAVVRDRQWGDQLLITPASTGPVVSDTVAPASIGLPDAVADDDLTTMPEHGGLAGDGTFRCTTDPDNGVFGALGSEPSISIPVVPPVVPMRASEIGKTVEYQVSATVRLSALGESVQVRVGPVAVPVPVVPVPTVLGVFSEVGYSLSKDGAKMFIAPVDVPVDTKAAIDQLRTVQSTLAKVQGIGRVAAFLTGVGSLLNTVQPPLDQRHKLLFKQFDQTRDLGKTASDWRHRRGWDDHGAEDDIDSAVLVSVDQKVQMYADQDFRGREVELVPGNTFHVLVPDFHDMTSFSPPEADVASGSADFSDKAHSLRFAPR